MTARTTEPPRLRSVGAVLSCPGFGRLTLGPGRRAAPMWGEGHRSHSLLNHYTFRFRVISMGDVRGIGLLGFPPVSLRPPRVPPCHRRSGRRTSTGPAPAPHRAGAVLVFPVEGQ